MPKAYAANYPSYAPPYALLKKMKSRSFTTTASPEKLVNVDCAISLVSLFEKIPNNFSLLK